MKDVKNYEGLYAVTSCGKVWSYKRKKFLNGSTYKGYTRVCLTKDGVEKYYFIHRLVAETYIPNPTGLPEVNHLDEIKSHNYVNNLEWCDKTYNINYGTRNERAAKSNSKAVICLELDKVFDSATEAGKQLNINRANISSCCGGKRQTAGGYHWEYVEG